MTQYIDIIFFAIIAAVLFFRLRNVIGETEDEVTPEMSATPMSEKKQKIMRVASSSAVTDALKAMVVRDESFSPVDFIGSAKQAFEMIVKAFALGDRNTLKMLLSEDLFKQFEADINEREAKGEVLQIIIKNFKRVQITDVDVRENYSQVEVTYEVEEIVYKVDLSGKIIDGSENEIETTTDIWTFEKEIDSTNPTWYLIKTRTDGDDRF